MLCMIFFFFQAEDGIRDLTVTGVQTCALPIFEGQAVDDVRASWQNATRLPFVVAMNCLNGLFDGIWDEESLAEALQRAPAGGAVAVWASSSVTASSTQALLNQELFRLIFQGTYATGGAAVAAA